MKFDKVPKTKERKRIYCMRYLFFDIECANCYKNSCKICEFGYVVTDENFEVIDKKLILINPKAPFSKYVINKLLNYGKEEYKESGYYTKYYNEIKELIEGEDQIIFGHSIMNDARYLNDESKRYNLPFINFEFYDLMYIYASQKEEEKLLGLEKMSIALGRVPSGNMHTSLHDALETMLNVKQICTSLSLTGEQLIERYKDSSGTTYDGLVRTIEGEKAKERRRIKNEARMERLKNQKQVSIKEEIVPQISETKQLEKPSVI